MDYGDHYWDCIGTTTGIHSPIPYYAPGSSVASVKTGKELVIADFSFRTICTGVMQIGDIQS